MLKALKEIWKMIKEFHKMDRDTKISLIMDALF